jgi:hypothetical protein
MYTSGRRGDSEYRERYITFKGLVQGDEDKLDKIVIDHAKSTGKRTLEEMTWLLSIRKRLREGMTAMLAPSLVGSMWMHFLKD